MQALRERGVQALALPLIDIAGPADLRPLDDAWDLLAFHALVMFVSANAVEHFFTARRARPWPVTARAGSTGPGTTTALRSAGVPAACIVEPAAGQALESESLWRQLQAEPWTGRRALLVRGEGGRDWLAEQLTAAGAEVQFLAAYRRLPPAFDASARQRLQDALHQPGQHIWHFSSSEAARNLEAWLPPVEADSQPPSGPPWWQATALATHPRIASAVRDLGFRSVHMVEPGLEALVSAVRALRSGAIPGSPAA